MALDDPVTRDDAGEASTILLASTSQFSGAPSGPSINDAWQISFLARRDDGSGGILVFTGTDFVPISLNNGPVPLPNDAAMDNAGVVAFIGFTATESSVFTGNGAR